MFVAQIYLNDGDQLSLLEMWSLFSFGVFFIIVPLIGNLIQLHNEIQVWIHDVYSKHCVQAWMRWYLRILYMFAILCGSSFAAVDICNSNVFHLSIFNMGLNKRQKAIFKNQRILSIVFFENIPQVVLQIAYSILTGQSSSISVITILAMIFSVLSIILSVFNYKSSSLLIECETITVIVMDVQSQQLANTPPKTFRQLIVHHRYPISYELSKIIEVNKRLIEILIPIQTKTGTKLTIYIRNNDSSDKKFASNIVNIIKNEIDSGSLTKVTIFDILVFKLLKL